MSDALKEYYSRKSTEELEELIRLDVDSDEGDGLEPEALDAILEVLQDRNYAEEYIKNGPSWEDFEKHYLPGLEERTDGENISIDNNNDQPMLSPSAPGSAKTKSRFLSSQTLKVAGITVAVTIILISVISVGAYAAGYNFWGAVAEWTSETFRFHSGDSARLTIPTADDYSGEYRSLESALEDNGVDVPLAPTWLPDGYCLTALNTFESQSVIDFSAAYSNTSGEVVSITIVQCDSSTPSLTFQEKDLTTVSEYETNGVTHYIFSNLDLTTITWINSGFECSISGNISVTNAHTMIDSIYER